MVDDAVYIDGKRKSKFTEGEEEKTTSHIIKKGVEEKNIITA